MRAKPQIHWSWGIAFALAIAAPWGRNEAAQQTLGKDHPLPVPTTAQQVHLLTREDAARGHRAVIRGVVICSLPEFEAVVVQDSTRGIYIDQLTGITGEPLRGGGLLGIDGITDPGEFAPQGHARQWARVGLVALTQPIWA